MSTPADIQEHVDSYEGEMGIALTELNKIIEIIGLNPSRVNLLEYEELRKKYELSIKHFLKVRVGADNGKIVYP
jgi:hypothetical protein